MQEELRKWKLNARLATTGTPKKGPKENDTTELKFEIVSLRMQFWPLSTLAERYLLCVVILFHLQPSPKEEEVSISQDN